MNHKRMFALFQLLDEDQRCISSKELALKLNVSSRTVRDMIKEIQDLLEGHGAQVNSKPGKGIQLRVTDRLQYLSFLDQLYLQEDEKDETRYRINTILYELLMIDGYHKVSNLSDQLYVTVPILTHCMRKVRRILGEYQLTLDHKPHYGLRICGDEFQFRLCMITHIDDLIERMKWGKNEKLQLNSYLYQILHEYNYQISEYALEQLFLYLLVMIKRLEQHHVVDVKQLAVQDITLESAIVDAIYYYIHHHYGITLTTGEKHSIIMFLLANRIFTIEECNAMQPSYLPGLIDVMLDNLAQVMNVDLRKDMELRVNLQIHLCTFDLRTTYHVRLHNPILEEIKWKYAFAYECAAIAVMTLQQHYGTRINEDEIAYFALLINISILRMRNHDNRKNILLVCCSGRGTSRLLQYEIQNRFARTIESIQAINFLELSTIQLSSWDFIFTTIDLKETYDIPIVKINNFLDSRDIKRITAALKEDDFHIEDYVRRELFFVDRQYRDKEEAVDLILSDINEVYPLPACFKDMIMKREENGKTEYADLFAMPHPYQPVTEDSFISITLLSKPLLWDEQKIKMIIILSTSKYYEPYTEQIYALLSNVLLDQDTMNSILHEKTYEQMLQAMKAVMKKEKEHV